MPTFRNRDTGRTVSCTGRMARRYEQLESYELVGESDIDKFAAVQEYVESGQAAYDVKHNPQQAFKINQQEDE